VPEVAIVGGGIAGLAAAYELSRQGVGCVVLERHERAGGVIFSEQVDEFIIDGGPDSLLVQKPAGIQLCEELGLGARLVPTKPPRVAYILRAGILHALPAASVLGIPTRVKPFLGSRLFSWPGKLRMGAELFVPRRRDDGGDESIGAFIARRFGREAATYIAEPLLAGIHAGDVDRLSVRALFPQFVEAERTHGSLLRAFRARQSGLREPQAALSTSKGAIGNPQSEIRNGEGVFRSLPGGLSELVRTLVQSLPPGTVQTGAAVTRVSDRPSSDSSPDAVESSPGFLVERATGTPVEARAVILAAPAFAISALTRDYDADLSRLCGEIPYASSAAIVLAFDRQAVRHPLNGSGFVVPRVEGSALLAVSWLSSKWPGRAPDDRVLMRAFVGGARDPLALERSDEELVREALSALTPLLGIAAPPLLSRVYRWERANAQHEVGHLARLAAIDHALGRHAGLYVTGSGFRGTGIPDCIADGRATARAAAAWVTRSRG
jgi:oxygen-dependent protoporphyrinogen oxidase